MSVHKSLVSKSQLSRQRNVLTREERIARLAKEKRWEEGDSVFGLPKVAVVKLKKRGKDKKKKKEEDADAAAAAEETTEEKDEKKDEKGK